VSTPVRTTASYVAALMMQQRGQLPVEVKNPRNRRGRDGGLDIRRCRGGNPADGERRAQPGSAASDPQFRRCAGRNAERGSDLRRGDAKPQACLYGKHRGVRLPRLSPDLAARLTNAFMLAGGGPDALDQAEAADISRGSQPVGCPRTDDEPQRKGATAILG